jgi:carbamoyltransferase
MTEHPTYILGISAFYHDSAAVLLKNGEIIAAAQEERFTRKKHDPRFPAKAAAYCLREAGIGVGDLAHVVFYDKPWLKFERLLETYLAYAPRGFRSFLKAMPIWLKDKLFIRDVIQKELGVPREKILFTEHHESHGASAFFPSPFEHAAVMTIDGVGEWATASIGVGRGNAFEILEELHFPHSLGLLYSAFTYYLGFRVNSGEYKVMGLAPYGKPVYTEQIYQLMDLKADGSFKLDMSYFAYPVGLVMTNKKFHALFGGSPRASETNLEDRHFDIAASIQVVTNEIVLRMARHARELTGERNLVMAGGVALNCVANSKIIEHKIFDEVWIQPAAGDAGGALGAALVGWHIYLGQPRTVNAGDAQRGSYLGPAFSDQEIEAFLNEKRIPYHKLAPDEIPALTAKLIEEGNVIGWFQGRMEFGPRALGGRSIVGDARSPDMQTRMNVKIKFRENFRPFAPSVIDEQYSQWFESPQPSPYMLLVADVKEEKRLPLSEDDACIRGLEQRKIIRSLIPAVTHVDDSARLQTVSAATNPIYHKLINAFYARTGCPVIINTSFNVRGEPIVCSPEDAYRCFMNTGMDYLVMNSFLLDKREQPASPNPPLETSNESSPPRRTLLWKRCMSWIKKVIFLSIPVIVFLVLTELVLQVFFPQLDPFVLHQAPLEHLTLYSDGSAMPGVSGTTTFMTDEIGFRTSAPISYLHKPENTIRLFFIGGSTIEQLYLDDSKECVAMFQKQMNEQLAASGSRYRVEAINTGRSGLFSVDHVLMAKEVEKYQPDYLVFMMGINDLGVYLQTKGDAASLKHYYASRYHESKRYIATRSQLMRLFFYTRSILNSLATGEVMDAAGSQYDARREKRKKNPLIPLEASLKQIPIFYTENVDLIQHFLERENIQGVFMTQPTMWSRDIPAELDDLLWMTPYNASFKYDTGELDQLMEKYNDVLRASAATSPAVDLLDLSQRLPKDTTVFYDDVHFNNDGAEKVTQILLDYFAERFKQQGIL